MLQMTITMFSQSLQRHTDVFVSLPPDPPSEEDQKSPYYQRPLKTILMLHGYNGSGRGVMLTWNVQNFATKYNLAVVCASAENSFYLNQKGTGRAYGDFFGIELPSFLRKHLGLFLSREDTLIAGFSMGGFGSLHVGMSHSEQFGGIIAVSSAMLPYSVAQMKPGHNDIADYDYYKQTFGEPGEVLQSTNNPEILLMNMKREGHSIPPIYMACGTEDMLFEHNQKFACFLREQKISFRFDTEPGLHNQEFAIPHLDTGIRYLLSLS